ncbi:MAG: hypothetical protein HOK58_04680, partial [Acidimicrobiaceae bacterium]|nr:hypothetical protein [Acidimicrobiaceae bacterium]
MRLFRERDPFETAVAAPIDDALQALLDAGLAFEKEIVDRLACLYGADLVQIPGRVDESAERRATLTAEALRNGVRFITGALLAPDVLGRRRSEVDLLVRVDRDASASGRVSYRPVDVKNHRATQRVKRKSHAEKANLVVNLDLSPSDGTLFPKRSAADCLQLAHYYRHLDSLGYADPGDGSGAVWGGVIDSRGMLAWFDLNTPAHTIITPEVDDDGNMTFHRRSGKTRRTSLEQYDFEFLFRLDVADAADARTSVTEVPPVVPVNVKECEQCIWQKVCGSELRAADDVSLVTGVGFPEWSLHRHLGNPTTAELAALDVETTAALTAHGAELNAAHAWSLTVDPDTLCEGLIDAEVAASFETAGDLQKLCRRTLAYTDSPIKPKALSQQIENARSVQAGGPVLRQQIEIPAGDIEIDFDLECTVNPARVYLWGAMVTHNVEDWPDPTGTYVPFACFEEMTVANEAQLVADLWAWLQQQILLAEQRGLTVRIYGYNLASTETSHLKRIAATKAAPGLPTLDELAEFTEHERYVDLLSYMKTKWTSNDGYSLKVMAPAHGFSWGDADPSGLNSIDWYTEALETGN